MILNFLQRRDPPILPSLQQTADLGRECDGGEQSRFADNVDDLKGCGDANKETLAELLFQFFRHYGYEFNYAKYVVSVKEGRLFSRKEKGWDPSNYQDKEARNRLCVEEPFTINRNLGNSADDYAWSGIHGEIRRAFDLIADGGQLEKCCEQYEFPQEEKPIFQKPAPKPKPTLTRSASQSGRSNHEPGSGRSRKSGNRNQSAQRAGNRRASSGASFSNQRVPLGFQSPPLSGNWIDYFAAAKGDLHNQLYQQYQLLQAHENALRSQLVQQQQQQAAHSQAQGRAGDLAGSPHYRPLANGFPSPRLMDNAPQTAPLLPGYLYHYPVRYTPSSSTAQSRPRDGGTSTNPSSPSLIAAVPALRRQVHRGSLPDGSSSSMRSQSQPGRSLPHPLTLQQQAHPGYDVSGALQGHYQKVRSTQAYAQNQPPMPLPFTPATTASYPSSASGDSAMPKEYVGYYVGQSPSLGPQYATASQVQMPPMNLRDPPAQRQRRVTPDLMPPLPNGKHSSRSPSPLGHPRSYSTASDLQSVQSHILQSPPLYELPAPTAPVPANVEDDFGGPLIVNGSGPSALSKQLETINGVPGSSNHVYDEVTESTGNTELARTQTLPMRPNLDTAAIPEQLESMEKMVSSPHISSSPRLKPGPNLILSPNGTPQSVNGTSEHFHEPTPITAPLLSPVAELRTPSPTHSTLFARESPKANCLMKAAKFANARQAERGEIELPVSPTLIKHERKGSAPNPTMNKPAKSPTLPTPLFASSVNPNPWQQATRKGHKKSKSTTGSKTQFGQPMPANECERKGG